MIFRDIKDFKLLKWFKAHKKNTVFLLVIFVVIFIVPPVYRHLTYVETGNNFYNYIVNHEYRGKRPDYSGNSDALKVYHEAFPGAGKVTPELIDKLKQYGYSGPPNRFPVDSPHLDTIAYRYMFIKRYRDLHPYTFLVRCHSLIDFYVDEDDVIVDIQALVWYK